MCKSQKDATEYQAETESLKVQVADLKMAVGTMDWAHNTVNDVIQEAAQTKAMLEDVSKWGRHFGLFNMIVVQRTAFGPKPKTSFMSSDPECFLPENQHLGVTLELYKHLPEKYHDLIWFADQGVGKSKFISAVCQIFLTTLWWD